MHGKKNIWVLLVAVGWVAFGALGLIAQEQNTSGAQPQAPTVQQVEATACGDFHEKFEAMRDGTHPLAAPVPGKALVYVISDIAPISPTIRVGMDRRWIGANRGGSYTSFYVSPGIHRVCVNWQSIFKRLNKLVAIKEWNAESGKIYYFRIQYLVVVVGINDAYSGLLNLDTVDSGEGQLLLAEYPHSTSKAKK